jgi:hypothetical protein
MLTKSEQTVRKIVIGLTILYGIVAIFDSYVNYRDGKPWMLEILTGVMFLLSSAGFIKKKPFGPLLLGAMSLISVGQSLSANINAFAIVGTIIGACIPIWICVYLFKAFIRTEVGVEQNREPADSPLS